MEKCKYKNFMPQAWIFILINSLLPLHSTSHYILYANVLKQCSFGPPSGGNEQNCKCYKSVLWSDQQPWEKKTFYSFSESLPHAFCFLLAVLFYYSQCYKASLKKRDTKKKSLWYVTMIKQLHCYVAIPMTCGK